jgi:hypothetical protein
MGASDIDSSRGLVMVRSLNGDGVWGKGGLELRHYCGDDVTMQYGVVALEGECSDVAVNVLGPKRKKILCMRRMYVSTTEKGTWVS